MLTRAITCPAENYRITENWAAYVDPASGQGVGVFSPIAETMTAYRVGRDGSTAMSDCSYFAPTMRFAIKPQMEVRARTGCAGCAQRL